MHKVILFGVVSHRIVVVPLKLLVREIINLSEAPQEVHSYEKRVFMSLVHHIFIHY